MIIKLEGKLVNDSFIEKIVDEIQARLAAKESVSDIWASVQSKINELENK